MLAGDIAAAIGLKDTRTGDTLCDEDKPVILEAMKFPNPVIDVAIEPKTKADQDKLGVALQKLAEEDPTFRVRSDAETGQTIIGGHGRAAPRDHRRPDEAGVQGRGQRGPAPGRLPGDDHPPGGERRGPVHPAVGRQGPVRPRGDPPRAVGSRARVRLRGQDRGRRDPPGVHQAGGGGDQGGAGGRRAGGLPDGGRQGDAGLRQLPRRGQLRNGLQDRRLDGGEGSGPPGRADPAGAGHGGGGGGARASSWATSSATSPGGGARSAA